MLSSKLHLSPSLPPISNGTMQDNWYPFYPYHQMSSESAYSKGASDNLAAPTDITSAPASTRVSVSPDQWSPAVTSVVDDSSLTAPLDVVENFRRVTRASYHLSAHLATMRPTPPTRHYADERDAYLRRLSSGAETHTPPTNWNAFNVADMYPNRSQIPFGSTDPGVFERGRMWSNSGCQAVVAPAQPTVQSGTVYPLNQTHTWRFSPSVAASYGLANQVDWQVTNVDGVSPRMAQPMLSQIPSPGRHTRRIRRARIHPERMVCDRCDKQMRRQSLKRHVKEVHDHIKRTTKPAFRWAESAGEGRC